MPRKMKARPVAAQPDHKPAPLYSVSPEVSSLAFLLGGGKPGTTMEEMNAAIFAAMQSR